MHEESYAVSSSHFGKKQTSLLVAAIWYVLNDKIESCYFDFVLSYISHNDVFYAKCYAILMEQLDLLVDYKISRIINVTDGGNHFVSRFAFWYLNLFNQTYGIIFLNTIFNFFFSKVLHLNSGFVHHIMEKENVIHMDQ